MSNKDDCISRRAAIDALAKELKGVFVEYRDIAEKLIGKLPSAQPKRIKGRWERKESDLSWWYECSECGESPLFDPYEHEVRTPFCPWCGADMRGEEDG